jgi:hypothetical protein
MSAGHSELTKEELMATPSASVVRSRCHGLLALVALVSTLAAAPARAQTAPVLELGLQAALAQIASAVVALSQGDAITASAELGEASALLDELAALAGNPTAKAEMGRLANKVRAKIRTVGRRVHKARMAVDSPKRFPQQLKSIKTAYAKGLKAASTISALVFADVDETAVGFHQPGDLVTFQTHAADGTPCAETPTVVVQPQAFPNVVDLSTVATWPDGTITMTMGGNQGCAFVTVTACGRSSTLLLYNYGPALARGFPANLPLGAYALSVRVTGAVHMPETLMGTIEFYNLQDFANELLAFLNQMGGQLDEVPGCAGRLSYSRFDGQSFTVKLAMSCSYAGQSASVTVIFKIEKV